MQLKGWMIDAARLPEPLPYYRKLIDFCASWGMNAILLRLTDDQGSAFRFASHPELATHLHAFSPQEMAGLAAYAAERGVELIPEVESFGHTGYITRAAEYAHLLDVNPESGSQFTGAVPNHPDLLALMADLYREIAEVFPSSYLHAGCDEVNWGGSAASQAMIAEQGRAGVWVAYLNRLNEIARAAGKELLIWADHVLGDSPEQQEILAGLSREIILVDWNYWDSDPSRSDGPSAQPGTIERRARMALERGFRLVGAPAAGWCRWNMRIGESQLRNIDAFVDIYRAIEHPSALGVLVTNWVPSRFIPGGHWDTVAYAGVALNRGSAAARTSAFREYVENHYGTVWNEQWADIFRTLYNIIPPRWCCSPAWMAPFLPVVWGDPQELRDALAGSLPVVPDLPFERLTAQIEQCAKQVSTNPVDFEAFALSVDYLAHIHWRTQAVKQAAAQPDSAAPALQAIATRDAQMVETLSAAWDRLRFVDDPAKTSLLPDLRLEDQPLLALRCAADFTARLAAEPAILCSLL